MNNSTPKTPDTRIAQPPARSNPYGGVEKSRVLSAATDYLQTQRGEKDRGTKGR